MAILLLESVQVLTLVVDGSVVRTSTVLRDAVYTIAQRVPHILVVQELVIPHPFLHFITLYTSHSS